MAVQVYNKAKSVNTQNAWSIKNQITKEIDEAHKGTKISYLITTLNQVIKISGGMSKTRLACHPCTVMT